MSEGSIIRGLIGSGIGAALGAGAWIACALYTEHELAVLAILLGGLTGLGMYLGYRFTNLLAGVAAAVIALLGILISRAVILHVLYESPDEVGEYLLWIVTATGPWGLLLLGIAMFMAFKVGASGPDSFED